MRKSIKSFPEKTRFKKYILALIILSFGLNNINGQADYNFDQFAKESQSLIKQPFKWDISDWGKFGIIASSTFLIIQFDSEIRNEFQKLEINRKSLPIETGRMWGEIYTTGVIGGVFAINGIVSDDKTSKKIAFEIFQSALYTGFITQSLKMLFGRSRPYTGEGSKSFNSFSKFSDDHWGLPSGHTSLAFSLSTVLSENSESDLLKILAFIPAIMTAYSRVIQDKHWTSDVFLGASIGYFVGKWVSNLHQKSGIEITQQYRGLQFSIPLN
jgi:hypothetical protein